MVISLQTFLLRIGEMCGIVSCLEQGCSRPLCLFCDQLCLGAQPPVATQKPRAEPRAGTKLLVSLSSFLKAASAGWGGEEWEEPVQEMIHLSTTFSVPHHQQMGDLKDCLSSQTSGDCSSGYCNLPTPVKPCWNLFVLGASTSTGGSEFPSWIMYVLERHSFVFVLTWLPGNFKGVPILSNLIWRMCAQWLDHRNASLI